MSQASSRRFDRHGEYASIGATALTIALLVWLSTRSFLTFHVFVELAAIITFAVSAVIAVNTRNLTRNGFVKSLSVSLGFVALLQALHTLAYKGMNVLGNPGADLPTQLWIAARGLFALNIAVATLFIGRDIRLRWTILANALVTTTILVTLFVWPVFPSCYIDGQGLTLFKIASEYIISAILILAMIRVWQKRQAFDRRVLRHLEASLAMSVISELLFTLYAGVYDAANVAGHVLLFLSSMSFYEAVVQTSLRHPFALLFRDLARSEQRLRTVADFTNDWETWQTPDGRLEYISPSCEWITGYPPERFATNPDLMLEIVHPQDREHVRDHMQRQQADREFAQIDFRIVTQEGDERWIGQVSQPVYGDDEFMGIRSSNRDITARKEAEDQRERVIKDLEASMARANDLKGLIPICSSCKKIRTESGYWQSVEQYVEEHSSAGFTHGICPDCIARLYPELTPAELAYLEDIESFRSSSIT